MNRHDRARPLGGWPLLQLMLAEALCFAGFVLGGVVMGFCLGGLLGPRLFGRGGQGLEELGFMFNGAILGGGLGAVAAVAAVVGLRRPLRRRLAGFVGVMAGLTALVTAIAVRYFDAW